MKVSHITIENLNKFSTRLLRFAPLIN